MADTSNVGIIVSLGVAIGGFVIALLTFWTKLTDRIAGAKAVAENALQQAEEAKHENETLRDSFAEMMREMDDRFDRLGRDFGEGLTALRQHHTEMAFFVRDNFVKDKDFSEAMKDVKGDLSKVSAKLDDVLKEMRAK